MKYVVICAALLLPACDDGCDEQALWAAIKEDVSGKLRSPASAEFDPDISLTSEKHFCGLNVVSYVDSQNGFGAMLRTKFTAFAAFKDDGSISVSSVTLN